MIEALTPRIKAIDSSLKKQRKEGKLAFMDLPYQEKVVQDILLTAKEIANRFEHFVVLGIGGSALGTSALHRALNHPFYNQLPRTVRKSPALYIWDNIDPNGFRALMDVIDIKSTCFNVISKSGTTAETNAQFLLFVDQLKELLGPKKYREHLIVTTDAKKGNFRKIADEAMIRSFIIPDGVGGRFSVLTPVGLLPTAVVGINIEDLLRGAAAMDKRCQSSNVWENPAYLNGTIHYLLDTKKGKPLSVMMPYADSLYLVADWYRQLWAESLGKKRMVNNKIENVGQTPIKALGVTDQHSQIQLYVEGPNDKIITFLRVQDYGTLVSLPQLYEDIPDIAYLGGHSLNELIQAEQAATELALTKNQRPNVTITLPHVEAFHIGELLYMLEVQTAFNGALYEINAFDQPGVEEGKEFTYGMLGRKGYEYKKQEILSRPSKDKKYML
ncbi:MAG: glucose-6-phosphate isomerase [Patescibacteria group bacterium]|nr:glucose-6-phosphate isomerase [Patescibacteria group bacterium]